jgi:hypothetical protein
MGTSFCNSGNTSKGSERLSIQTTAFALLSALTNALTGAISSKDSIKQLSFSNLLISSKYASGEKQYNSSGLTTALLLFDSFFPKTMRGSAFFIQTEFKQKRFYQIHVLTIYPIK